MDSLCRAANPSSVSWTVSQTRLNVLHVPFTYFPDPAGGTEYYVAALIAALREHGIDGAVAAPGTATIEYVHENVGVHRFDTTKRPGLPAAYGEPDEDFAESFRELL